MFVILTGSPGTGKDTLADLLCERYVLERRAFADPLRAMALVIDPNIGSYGYELRLSTAVEELGWRETKDRFPAVRTFLQRLGTDAVRNHLGKDVWVRALLETTEPGVDYVVTDARFLNEVTMLRPRVVIRVTRPGVPAVASKHPSDKPLHDRHIDVTVVNDGRPEDMLTQLGDLLDSKLKKRF